MRPPAPRSGPALLVSAAVLCLSIQCQSPAPEPVAPPPPPTSPPTAPPAPATLAPTSAAAPDAGFTITAGAPVIVAEAPIVTADPRKPAPRPAAPGTPSGGQARPSPAPPPEGAREVSAQAVIRSHFSDVEACYGPVALKDPSVGGRIVVQWTLGADGTPTAVAITQDTLRSAAVTDCIKARARGWRFPPPVGGVAVVRYPFDLKVQ